MPVSVIWHPSTLEHNAGLEHLTPEERVRYDFALLVVFRRLEAVYVQAQLGSIEQEMTAGSDRDHAEIEHIVLAENDLADAVADLLDQIPSTIDRGLVEEVRWCGAWFVHAGS